MSGIPDHFDDKGWDGDVPAGGYFVETEAPEETQEEKIPDVWNCGPKAKPKKKKKKEKPIPKIWKKVSSGGGG